MPFVNAATIAAGSTTPALLPAGLHGARVRASTAAFTCASDAAGTYTVPIVLPKGARVLAMFTNASATMGGTATIAIGIAGATGKYRAAATHTAADTLTFHSLATIFGVELTADEQIIMTTASAALPSSGTLTIGFLYTID